MRGAAAKSLSAFLLLFFHHRQQQFFRSESWIKGSLGHAAETLYQRLVSCKPGGCCCHLVRGHLTLTFSPSSCLPSTWTSTKQGATSREGRRSSIVCGLASDLICDCRCLPPKRLRLHTWRHNCAASSTLSLHLVTSVYRTVCACVVYVCVCVY